MWQQGVRWEILKEHAAKGHTGNRGPATDRSATRHGKGAAGRPETSQKKGDVSETVRALSGSTGASKSDLPTHPTGKVFKSTRTR